MKLTRLRLLGFKSFVEPTDFLIEPGLTGVVGPNGCGKSNLVEALRWVMGETSFKSMRASEMDDVIFAGTGLNGGLHVFDCFHKGLHNDIFCLGNSSLNLNVRH